MGLFDRLKQGLQKTKEVLRTDVRDLFKAGEILDDKKIEEFEARLIKTDMGVASSSAICEEIRKKHGGRTVILEEIEETVKEKIRSLLEGEGDTTWDLEDPLSPLHKNSDGVTVILVAGVNGVGKTTSIAKLANLIIKQNKTVLLAAGDTFRAAAVEQLTMWANRLGCDIVTRPDGTDPASVAYSGCERALETGVDYLIIDTAGRLQTHTNLMEELHKIKRVIAKKDS